MYSDPNSAQHSALFQVCRMHSVHTLHVQSCTLRTLLPTLCTLSHALCTMSHALGSRLLRHRPQAWPCSNTKTVSHTKQPKPIATDFQSSTEAPLSRHQGSCYDTKGHVATPNHSTTQPPCRDNWVMTPKALAAQHPIATLNSLLRHRASHLFHDMKLFVAT